MQINAVIARTWLLCSNMRHAHVGRPLPPSLHGQPETTDNLPRRLESVTPSTR